MLVSASEQFNAAALRLLPMTDYYPVTTVKSLSEARRTLVGADFDLVLVNAPLRDGMGVDFAVDACSDSDAGVLLLVKSELYEETYYKVLPSGVITLAKPTNAQMLAQSLRVLCAIRERLRALRRQQSTVEEKIEELRLVNRAKWLLIERRQMTEPEAHRYIIKTAMEQRLEKRALAEKLIAELEQA